MTPAEKRWRINNKDRVNAYRRQWCKENREKATASRRRNRDKNRDAYNAYQREYRLRNIEKCRAYATKAARKKGHRPRPPRLTPDEVREHRRESYFRRRYGMSMSLYNELISSSRCGICGIKPDRPVVDHCHNVGHVRGILCSKCNQAIGLLDNSSNKALQAFKYLQREELFQPSNQ